MKRSVYSVLAATTVSLMLLAFSTTAGAWGGDGCDEIDHSMTVYNNSSYVIRVSSSLCHSCENSSGCISGGGGPGSADYGIVNPGSSKTFDWVNDYEYKDATTLKYTAQRKDNSTKYTTVDYSGDSINGNKTWNIADSALQ